MRLRDLGWSIPGCFIVLMGAGAGAQIMPTVDVAADRPSYVAGETAVVRLKTHVGAPSDVFIILTTPTGERFYADQALQFRRWRVAAATNFALGEGEVDMPVSLATSKLARPGEYKVEVYVSPPGQGEGAGALTGEARFLVALPGLNYLAIHDPQSPQYDGDCHTCHADKTRYVFLAPGIPSFHALKWRMFSAGQVAQPCTLCHDGADLIDFSQASLRKTASSDFCAQCHGGFGPGKRLFAK